jgi:solute:Na+ symporter, SSS family
MSDTAVSMPLLLVMTAIFIVFTIILGLYGYRNTKNNQEFLLGRNKSNSLIIGLSYGATFLSASAVIGFGGQSAIHGMSLIWLCFLNLFLGLFVAFLVFGKRTRKIGLELGASTFADLLGKVYSSKGIRAFTAILIIVMMPIYCAAVLKGGVNTLAVITGLTEYYNVILVLVAVIVGLYVVYGGIVAVMYNDALQAGIMFVGMAIILVATYSVLGGVTEANSSLSGMWDSGIWSITSAKVLPGFNGWTSFSDFGSAEWLTVVTTFIMGVGIGALTQPQLIVRFMSAKDDKMLNRSLIVGSIFMLVIVGTAYTVGALSNVYFYNEHGQIAAQYVTLGVDYIIPEFVMEIFSSITFGDVFVCLFLLSIVCAAISTLSALMHTIGSAGGYDLYTLIRNRRTGQILDSQNIRINRICTAIVMVLIVVYCYLMPSDIIAKATSLFMGMTAAALLPTFAHGLYSKKPNKEAAIASMVAGTGTYLFWALFINASSSVFLPICKWLTGSKVLFVGSSISYVDALVVALPVSIICMFVVLEISKHKARQIDTTTAS